jgi:uncharacterized protein YqgC (DUF456 family)
MTTGEIIGLSLTLLVMLIGFGASFIPGLPGPPLVLVAAVIHRLWFGQHSVSAPVLIGLTTLTIASVVLDYSASLYGAKRFGATWRGIVGAMIGGFVGIFFNIPGIIIGPFLGAMVFELLGGYEIDKASRAGLGATLGVFAGVLGKCIICAVMIAVFAVDVIMRS